MAQLLGIKYFKGENATDVSAQFTDYLMTMFDARGDDGVVYEEIRVSNDKVICGGKCWGNYRTVHRDRVANAGYWGFGTDGPEWEIFFYEWKVPTIVE
jgi:hypothetical protein